MYQTPPPQRAGNRLFFDLVLFGISIAAAITLSKIGVLESILDRMSPVLGSFFAGVLFTTAVTTPFSVAVILKLSAALSPFLVAIIGMTGAFIVDSILFLFFRERVARDIKAIADSSGFPRLMAFLERRIFHWLVPLVAALAIASPVPDELAIALLGLSGFNLRTLAAISLPANFVGILVIALLGRALF